MGGQNTVKTVPYNNHKKYSQPEQHPLSLDSMVYWNNKWRCCSIPPGHTTFSVLSLSLIAGHYVALAVLQHVTNVLFPLSNAPSLYSQMISAFLGIPNSIRMCRLADRFFAWQGKNTGILADFNGFHGATARSQSKQFLTKSKQKIYRQYVCHN